MIARVLTVGLLAGLLAGLVVATLQHFLTTPLIIAAEAYERPDGTPASGESSPLSGEAHDHSGTTAWKPAEGLQRTAFTSIATVATAIGFAMILLAGMLVSGDDINTRTALGWSVAAFAAVGLAPALGLAPELPGSAAGPLLDRQIWWVETALATGAALWLLLRVDRMIAKLLAVALIVAPHLIGAPQIIVSESRAPAELAARFVTASLAVQAALWILSGLAAGALWVRYDRRSAA